MVNAKFASFSIEDDGALWVQLKANDGAIYLLQAKRGHTASLGFFKWDTEQSNWAPFWTLNGN